MNTIELCFWVSLFIVFYAHLGYGILLYILIKIKRILKPDSHQPDIDYLPHVSLIIPCFNEVDFINDKIDNTLTLDYPKEKLEVIFIADGSNDGTEKEVEKRLSEGIKSMFSAERQGKAAAMNRAVAAAKGDVLIFCDANTKLNPEAVRRIANHFHDPGIGGVAGTKKVMSEEADSAGAAGEGIYWKYESTLKKWDSEFYTVVGAAGELMAYRKDLYRELEKDTLLDDFMQSMRIAEDGYRVLYEPEAVAMEYASENVEEELKRKIRIASGGHQSMKRLRKARNPFHNFTLWFQYVSHRVLRWSIAAYLLPVLLILNYLLMDLHEFYHVLFLLQVVFYCMGIAGYLLENRKIRLKVLFVPYYFLVMNYAVFAGYIRYKKGSQSALWERAKRRN